MQLCNEGGANESIKGVLKTFNVGAIAKIMTEILVDFRQIINESIEADQEVKIVFNDKVKIICWVKKSMQSQKRSSQRIKKAQRWSRIWAHCWCNSWCRRMRSSKKGWMQWAKPSNLLVRNKFNKFNNIKMSWTLQVGSLCLQERLQQRQRTTRQKTWTKSLLVEQDFLMDHRQSKRWRRIQCHRLCLRYHPCLWETTRRGSTNARTLGWGFGSDPRRGGWRWWRRRWSGGNAIGADYSDLPSEATTLPTLTVTTLPSEANTWALGLTRRPVEFCKDGCRGNWVHQRWHSCCGVLSHATRAPASQLAVCYIANFRL